MILRECVSSFIDNIGAIGNEVNGRYYIIAEWSREPIESFDNIKDTLNFLRGFKGISYEVEDQPYKNGQMLKMCITADLEESGGLIKVKDLQNVNNFITLI